MRFSSSTGRQKKANETLTLTKVVVKPEIQF